LIRARTLYLVPRATASLAPQAVEMTNLLSGKGVAWRLRRPPAVLRGLGGEGPRIPVKCARAIDCDLESQQRRCMGNVNAQRGRLAPALILTFLVALCALAALLVTENANAAQTFEPGCSGCHSMSAVHGVSSHPSDCSACHTDGNTANPPKPSACASCHGAAKILARTTHPASTCGVTGCHGAAPPPTATPTPTPTATPPATVVATTVTAKVAPTAIRLGKTVKTTGAVTPIATLAGKKVALRVDFKKGTKWVKAKTATATVTAAGAFSWKYKPLKKGTFRVKASVAATATYKASKTAYKTFKVK
jgi:hypothetical protein